MSEPTSNIHPGYRILWLCWLVAQVVTISPLWNGIWVSWGLWAFFAFLEGAAVFRDKPGDTLSEFMQSIAAKSPDSHWWQSWKALVSMLTVMLSMQAGWTAAYGEGPMDRPWLGAVVGLGVFFWLLFHWLNPRKHK